MTKMWRKLEIKISNFLILIWEVWFCFSALLGFLVIYNIFETSSTTVNVSKPQIVIIVFFFNWHCLL
jgi:hypothetical protein